MARLRGRVGLRCDDWRVDDELSDDQETVTSWTNPYTAAYKRRQAMPMAMGRAEFPHSRILARSMAMTLMNCH